MDAASVYRKDYGKTQTLTRSCGTVEIRRPRVRSPEARFEGRILPCSRNDPGR